MKKIIFTKWIVVIGLVIFSGKQVKAQWSNSAPYVYTTYYGTGTRVGIGTSAPARNLHVVNSGGWKARFSGPDGYIDFGPANSSWAHIYTDRPNFIFNKPVYSVNGFLSLNSTLNLEAASGHYVQIKPRSSSYGLILREYNSNDYGNIEVTSAGLGLGYNTSGSQLMIKTNGYIGIGTSNPSRNLHVVGSVKFDIDTDRNLIFSSWELAGSGGMTIGTANDANSAHKPLAFAASGFLFHGGPVRVGGSLIAQSIRCKTDIWSDFVFDDDYKLRKLTEVEEYINKHKHLPDVPSEKEVIEKGIDVAKMNALLLQKIEELTLYLLQQNKKIKELETEIKTLKK